MDKLNITDVLERDLPDILSLVCDVSELDIFPTLSRAGQQVFKESQKKSIWGIVDTEKYKAVKVKVRDEIVAYIAWREGIILSQLVVASECQGKGIGTLLVDEVVKRAASQNIKVKSSLNAFGFYKKYGFLQTGEKKETNSIIFIPMEYIACT